MSSKAQDHRQPPDPTNGLPANHEAESFLLGAILLDSAHYLPVIRSLVQVHDFSLVKNQRIYRRVLELHDRGVKVDRVTVLEALRSHRELSSVGISYVHALDDNMPQLVNADEYAKIVKAKAIRRRFIFSADALTNRALSSAETNEVLLTAAADTVRLLQAESGQQTEAPIAVPQWPDPLDEAAFHGVAGELVRRIEPESEADPAALLLQLLTAWGSLAGRGPYYLAEEDRHHTNLFCGILGVTAKGRKGVSWGRTRGVLKAIDACWVESCLLAGVGSGDPTADELLRALRAAGSSGLTRWDLMNHFSRKKSADELDRAIGVLTERGLIRSAAEETAGRTAMRFWAT
jgi:hypothetical protein